MWDKIAGFSIFVPNVATVIFAKVIQVFVFQHYVNYFRDKLKFLNINGNKNGMIGLKVTAWKEATALPRGGEFVAVAVGVSDM